MHVFAFESYGVRVRIESNRKRIIDRARRIVQISLLGRSKEIDPSSAAHVFKILNIGKRLVLDLNGEQLSDSEYVTAFYNYFESRVRVLVGEFATDLVFLHAGAISWKGRGIIFPADSFQGKTTLVAALLKRGAVYYSDDYAILDENGLLHSFPRRLSIRDPEREFRRSNIAPGRLGGTIGDKPVPVDAVIITRFREGRKWNPKILSAGKGIIAMLPQAITIRANTKLTLDILKKVTNHAIIARSFRGDTKLCLEEMISFFEKIIL